MPSLYGQGLYGQGLYGVGAADIGRYVPGTPAVRTAASWRPYGPMEGSGSEWEYAPVPQGTAAMMRQLRGVRVARKQNRKPVRALRRHLGVSM